MTGNIAGLTTVLSSRLSHTQNCAVYSVNPTVCSVYLPTPRWHHLKAHPFLAIHSADEHRMIYSFSKYHFLLRILRFLFFFSDNIMADVASKQQRTALFCIHHSHTHKKTHTTDKKTDKPDGKPVLCQRTFSSVFRSFFYTVKMHSLT